MPLCSYKGIVTLDFYKGFHFESYWTSMSGFKEIVQSTWDQLVHSNDANLRFHVKMRRTAKALKIWRRQNIGNIPLQLAMVQVTLLHLELAQEDNQLSGEELEFHHYLKAKALGLAAIQKARAKQHSRLSWIRQGDTNTSFFQIHSTVRREKIISGTSTLAQEWHSLRKKKKRRHSHISSMFWGRARLGPWLLTGQPSTTYPMTFHICMTFH
jgi:hypothetical protein